MARVFTDQLTQRIAKIEALHWSDIAELAEPLGIEKGDEPWKAHAEAIALAEFTRDRKPIYQDSEAAAEDAIAESVEADPDLQLGDMPTEELPPPVPLPDVTPVVVNSVEEAVQAVAAVAASGGNKGQLFGFSLNNGIRLCNTCQIGARTDLHGSPCCPVNHPECPRNQP